MIEHFFDKSVIIRRLSTVSGYRKNYVSTGTIDAHVQKLSDEATFRIYGVYGATHKMWCDVNSNVQEGDKVVVGSDEYTVVATNQHDYGNNVHLEVILKKYNA